MPEMTLQKRGAFYIVLILAWSSRPVQGDRLGNNTKPGGHCLFMFDATSNVDEKQEKLMGEAYEEIAKALPPTSTVMGVAVSDRMVKLFDTTAAATVGTSIGTWKTNGQKMTSHVLEETYYEANFGPNEYRKKPEVAFLLITDRSHISIHGILLKKKLFVLFFGRKVNEKYKLLASSPQHVFLIKNADDIQTVARRVADLTEKDFLLLCDRNSYREERGSRCYNCSEVCAHKTKACNNYCPYRLSKEQLDLQESTSLVVKVDHDNKYTVIAPVLSAVVVLSLVLIVYTYKTEQLCFEPKKADALPYPETQPPGQSTTAGSKTSEGEQSAIEEEKAEQDQSWNEAEDNDNGPGRPLLCSTALAPVLTNSPADTPPQPSRENGWIPVEEAIKGGEAIMDPMIPVHTA